MPIAHGPLPIAHFLAESPFTICQFCIMSISDNLDEGVPGGLPLQENLDILQNDVHLQVG